MSSIGSVGSSSSAMMQGMQGMRKRPDPAQMAENLFSKLDASSQGYIEKSDLQAAFDKIGSSDSASSSTSVDELFSKLDTDSDGKVTQQEFSDTLRQVSEQLDNQFANMRMQGGGMGGMPPPPGGEGGEGDEGFTKDELSSQLEEIGSTDSKRSSLISNIVSNFDEADSDGNGKVSFQEAMAYDQASKSSSASSATSTDGSATVSSSGSDTSTNKLMAQIMRLMQAYSVGADASSVATSSISVSA